MIRGERETRTCCRWRAVAATGAAGAAAVAVGLTLALPAGAATPDQVVVSESPAKRSPNVVDGTVSAIVQIGNTIVVGGSFGGSIDLGGLRIRTRLSERHGILVSFESLDAALGPTFEPRALSFGSSMGLALSLCRSMIEMHGGQLWAAPNCPDGSLFSFTLPVCIPRR